MNRTIWQNCHVATMRDGRWNAIEHAAIVTEGDRIVWVGERDALPKEGFSDGVASESVRGRRGRTGAAAGTAADTATGTAAGVDTRAAAGPGADRSTVPVRAKLHAEERASAEGASVSSVSPVPSLSATPPEFPASTSVVDLGGAWVTPALIDCHTHAVFGGNRSNEFEMRLEGMSYADIAAAGGGIAGSVRMTRQSDFETLYASARQRVLHLMREGVTVVEIKSGYGLNLETERRMLQVARRLGEDLPVTVRATCLAAHAVPPEFRGRPQDYVQYVCDDMLPVLVEAGLVDAVDGFCETVAFSVAQCQQVLERARSLGVPFKLHTEQMTASGGAGMAARLGAMSVEHVEYLQEADIRLMAEHGTVAVLLPGAFHMLREKQRPPVEMLREYGVPMALSTDLNPGTSPALSLRLMLNFGCVMFGMTPEEAVAGATVHAARALGMQDTHGCIEPGKVADFVAWQIDRPADLVYWLGGQIPHRTIRHGAAWVLPPV